MKNKWVHLLGLLLSCSVSIAQIPQVFSGNQSDLIQSGLNHKAALSFEVHPVPRNIKDWEDRRIELRKTVREKTGARIYPDLPMDYKETHSHNVSGVTVKNIYFQSRPGIYATANLYIPEGEGPFPAVITMMGHSSNGRLYDVYQAIGQSLAQNGYVSLHMDPWGSGERTTEHAEFQYHGAHLGASLFNVGESLLGMQITDNMRGVDLLTSLPFVDSEKIGATGSSGGGNQTMWLAAMDDRIKAAMPVVSVGTFQSYIMASNCVCETLVDGLNFTEESQVLGLVAPRALKLVNAGKEANKAFIPDEMKRSFNNTQPIFDFYGAKDHLTYQVFDMTHGYHPEVREALLGWMDLHLMNKGDGTPRSVGDFELLTSDELMTFKPGDRPAEVMSTDGFCRETGKALKEEAISEKGLDMAVKKSELKNILRVPSDINVQKVHSYGRDDGWDRYALEISGDYLLPVLVHPGSNNSSDFVLIAHNEGKAHVPIETIESYIKEGKGLVLVDLWGLGESGSSAARQMDGRSLPAFHTLARAKLWLGESMQGHWTGELHLINRWLTEHLNVNSIAIHAYKDIGPAALYYSTLYGDVNQILLENAPMSYLFNSGITDNYYSMAIHVPGILPWGDLSMAAALTGADISMLAPRTISGKVCGTGELEDFQREYDTIKSLLGTKGKMEFK